MAGQWHMHLVLSREERELEDSIWLFKKAFAASIVFLSGDIQRAPATQPWVFSCMFSDKSYSQVLTPASKSLFVNSMEQCFL